MLTVIGGAHAEQQTYGEGLHALRATAKPERYDSIIHVLGVGHACAKH